MNEVPKKAGKNNSLRKKSSARLAAVQCLYQAKMRGYASNPAALIDQYSKQLNDSVGDKEIRYSAPPDMKLFSTLITGVCEHQDELAALIESSLKDNWKKERMSPLILSLLEAALFELQFAGSLKPAMVINEYVTLSASFFNEQETNFINALLDKAAPKHP